MSVSIDRAESALVSSELKTTSLKVAESFGKQHQHVLRTIRELEIPDDFRKSNFGHREEIQQHSTGATRQTIIEMTRDGFVLLAMGFTGKKAMTWKIKYLQAFNAMETALIDKAPALPKPRTLTNVQARTLQRMIRERWSDAKEREAAYERLKDRFEVPKYKQIAREDFEAAVGFIADDSPTPIPPFLRDGRYLLVVDDGKTSLRDAGGKSLIDTEHVRTLLRNFRTLTSQMRVCFGEVGDETMELPIEALKRKVTP